MENFGLSEKYTFSKAVPVWEKGQENEMNFSLLFRTVFTGKEPVRLKIAAHSRYQIFVNGSFYAAGPARAAHGFYRVDEYVIDKGLVSYDNCIGIITAGYNVNSFYLVDEPSFLCAELEKDGEVIAATGTENGFEAIRYLNRTRKVPRYSFQRPFTEVYDLDGCYDIFFKYPDEKYRTVELVPTEEKNFITRKSPYCEYREKKAESIVAKGVMKDVKEKRYHKDRSLKGIGEQLKGFPEEQLSVCPVNEIFTYRTAVYDPQVHEPETITLQHNTTAIYDMGVNTTGYVRISLFAQHDVILYAVFTEIRDEEGESLYADRNHSANVIKWAIQGGRHYDLVSFEPYTYRYIQLYALYSAVDIMSVSQYRESYPESKLVNLKKMPDEGLQKIYDAAVESFVQNTTDIFMDCPSRERAGWLCDSFFTSRVERELTGKSLVEHDFLENFLLPDSFKNIPDGMLPMCYPADHYDGCYIPNWAMWYVLELKEYLDRTGDRKLIDAAKEKVYKLASFFEKYENGEGLLEKLDNWVFIEWSEANDFVQDINYPSNMLYSMFLDNIAELYGDNAMSKKAAKLRCTIEEKSFDGEWFCDNAVIDENGTAARTGNHTETCQYYAFFTKTATKEKYPELYNKMMNEFGPSRNAAEKYPDVPVSNAFIGNYLRLELLFMDGMYDKLEKEIRDFFLPMAEQTGTLWENMHNKASCNHGFASHVTVWLNKIK